MRIGYDSNILAYLAGVDRSPADAIKIKLAHVLQARLSANHECVVPMQALGELYTVLVKAGAKRVEARAAVGKMREIFELAPPNEPTLTDALDLATDHKLQFWDALILATAAHSGCTLLLSEDMQDGFAWRGLTVANPFAETPNRKLARVMKE